METRPCILHRLINLGAALALWSLYAPSPLAAQDSSAECFHTTRDTLTAALLKRVGYAVDGYRTGRPVWVVVQNSAPYEILTVTSSCRDALRLAQGSAERLFLGPYVAPSDSDHIPILLGGTCKRMDTSPCSITDSLFIPPQPVDSIARVTLTFRLKNGRVLTAVYRPDSVEAIFLTLSAVDKLLIPYYTSVYGINAAQGIRTMYYNFFTRGEHQ